MIIIKELVSGKKKFYAKSIVDSDGAESVEFAEYRMTKVEKEGFVYFILYDDEMAVIRPFFRYINYEMSQIKDPKDYKYGSPCKDHLGNEYINAKEMCKAYNIPYETYQSRKKNGWDIKRILTTPPRNYMWHSPARNMGMPTSKKEKREYKNYRGLPGTRYLMDDKK